MAGKCVMCGQPLTDPISQRRGMGDDCAAKHLIHTAPNDEALLVELEQLAAESPQSRVIRDTLAEVRAIRFRQPENSVVLMRILEWHLTIGKTHRTVPVHLLGVARALQCYIQDGYRTPIGSLRRSGYQVEGRRDAVKLIAELGAVVPEVLALVEVVVPDESRSELTQAV